MSTADSSGQAPAAEPQRQPATDRLANARRGAGLRAAAVFAVVIALDQITKHTLGTWIAPGQVRHVIPGLQLVYERNSGVAFSFLTGAGALVYVVIGVAVIALVVHLWLRPSRRLLWLATGMLVGGAIGNLIDRVARGSVIDFIKLPHWPAFNLADTSITLGVIILAVTFELDARAQSRASAGNREAARDE